MTDLRQAAQALLNQWDSPLWNNGSTANAIADLRTALEQQQAEPILTHRITSWGHCGVCRHDRIPGEGCARQECPDSPQQQAEPVAVVDEVIHAAWAAGFVEGEKAALEQQAEPVGWLDGNDKLADFMHRDLKAEHDKRGSATPKDFTIPVYTAPPQRKELSASEILNMMPSAIPAAYDGELMEFARAVEAKIKEGT